LIPGEFEYVAPDSLEAAMRVLAERADATLLSGGMSLLPAVKHRLAQPGLLVDIGRVPKLEGVADKRGTLVLGARVTHGTIATSSALGAAPIMAETARVIGDVQVRNRGTIGGSLVHADPAADWPAVFLALDGKAVFASHTGTRTVAAADFFKGMLRSDKRAGEVLTEVHLTCERKRAGAAYVKLRQAASGFAVVGVAAQVVLGRRGDFERVSLGVTGINPVPFRASSVESRLVGETPEARSVARACSVIEEAAPLDDLHASADYRRHLASVYARRAIAAALERARE